MSTIARQVPKMFSLRNLAMTIGVSSIGIVGAAEVDARCYENGDGLPLVYDPIAIENYWLEHHCIVMCRIGTIVGKVLPFLSSSLWQLKFSDPTVGRRMFIQSCCHRSSQISYNNDIRRIGFNILAVF